MTLVNLLKFIYFFFFVWLLNIFHLSFAFFCWTEVSKASDLHHYWEFHLLLLRHVSTITITLQIGGSHRIFFMFFKQIYHRRENQIKMMLWCNKRIIIIKGAMLLYCFVEFFFLILEYGCGFVDAIESNHIIAFIRTRNRKTLLLLTQFFFRTKSNWMTVFLSLLLDLFSFNFPFFPKTC